MTDPAAVADQFADAWNHKDATRLGGLFGEDATFINVFGETHQGRQTVTDIHAWGFTHTMQLTTLTVNAHRSRSVSDAALIVVADWTLAGQTGPDGVKLPPRDGVMSVLVVRDESAHWLIHTLHNQLKTDPPR